MTTNHDVSRRWVREIADLRRRAVRAGVHASVTLPGSVANVLGDALDICNHLLQSLAGAHLQCDNLTERLNDERVHWQHLFDQLPVACITTDRGSVILDANQSAAGLLNVTRKNLGDRLLLHFVADRAQFTTLLGIPPLPQEGRCTVTVRPRERKPVEVEVRVTLRTPGDPAVLMWFLVQTPRERPASAHVAAAVPREPALLEHSAG